MVSLQARPSVEAPLGFNEFIAPLLLDTQGGGDRRPIGRWGSSQERTSPSGFSAWASGVLSAWRSSGKICLDGRNPCERTCVAVEPGPLCVPGHPISPFERHPRLHVSSPSCQRSPHTGSLFYGTATRMLPVFPVRWSRASIATFFLGDSASTRPTNPSTPSTG